MSAVTLERSPESEEDGARRRRWWRPVHERSLSAWCCVGLIVSTMFAGDAEYLGLPVPPHRVFLVLTLAALTNELMGRRLRPKVRGVHVFMIATLGWALCSAIAFGTLHTSVGFFALLDRLAIPFLGFVIAPLVFRTDRDRDLLLKCLILVGIYLGVTAFFEVIGPQSLIRPAFINDPSIGIHYGRARGPFLSAEPDGLIMMIGAFAGWCGFWRLRGLWRLVALAVIPIASLGCLLTMTRSIWLGFGLAFLIACWRDRWLRWALPVAGAVLVGGLLFALSHYPQLRSDAQTRADTNSSVYDRVSTNAAAVRIVEEHPVFGIGWVNFMHGNQEYVRQADDKPMGFTNIETHNVFLGRAAEIGLPGLALWLGAVALGPLRVVVRRGPPGRNVFTRIVGAGEPVGWGFVATAAALGWMTTLMLSPVPYPLPNLMVWLLAGLVLAEPASARPGSRPAAA